MSRDKDQCYFRLGSVHILSARLSVWVSLSGSVTEPLVSHFTNNSQLFHVATKSDVEFLPLEIHSIS